ncbi:MAG: tetratricopeptide repeat protein [Promethearchaeota archaeon]
MNISKCYFKKFMTFNGLGAVAYQYFGEESCNSGLRIDIIIFEQGEKAGKLYCVLSRAEIVEGDIEYVVLDRKEEEDFIFSSFFSIEELNLNFSELKLNFNNLELIKGKNPIKTDEYFDLFFGIGLSDGLNKCEFIIGLENKEDLVVKSYKLLYRKNHEKPEISSLLSYIPWKNLAINLNQTIDVPIIGGTIKLDKFNPDKTNPKKINLMVRYKYPTYLMCSLLYSIDHSNEKGGDTTLQFRVLNPFFKIYMYYPVILRWKGNVDRVTIQTDKKGVLYEKIHLIDYNQCANYHHCYGYKDKTAGFQYYRIFDSDWFHLYSRLWGYDLGTYKPKPQGIKNIEKLIEINDKGDYFLVANDYLEKFKLLQKDRKYFKIYLKFLKMIRKLNNLFKTNDNPVLSKFLPELKAHFEFLDKFEIKEYSLNELLEIFENENLNFTFNNLESIKPSPTLKNDELQDYDAYFKLNRKEHIFWKIQGKDLYNQKKFKEAAENFETALSLKNDDLDLYIFLLDCYEDLKDSKKLNYYIQKIGKLIKNLQLKTSLKSDKHVLQILKEKLKKIKSSKLLEEDSLRSIETEIISSQYIFGSFDENPQLKSKDCEKLKKILKTSKRIEIIDIANILNLDEDFIWENIFDWAEKFDFIIDDEILEINSDHLDKFIEELINQYCLIED